MSTTRSLSTPAPATERAAPGLRGRRLFLVGHGSTRAAEDNRALLRHRERLAARALFDSVEVGLLYGEPSAQAIASDLPRDSLYVVPLFMAGGDYPRRAIPALFGLADDAASGEGPIFCPPVGLHPRLADLVVERARKVLRRRRLPARETTLLVVGHGSRKSRSSWHATETQAARMRARGPFRTVATAYLEQDPSLESVLRSLDGPLVVAGLFAAEGAHAGRDIPTPLGGYQGGPVVYLGAIGADPAIAELVLDQVAAADPSFRR